jgi:arsenite methyltransferase
MSGRTTGLVFSKEAADKLIATYNTPDLVRQRDATLQRLNLRPGEHVIDIGCGPGFLCKSMVAAIGPKGRVVGIDISEDLIEFATKDKSGESIEYRVGSATAVPFSAEQFDVAVARRYSNTLPTRTPPSMKLPARYGRAAALSLSIRISIRGSGTPPMPSAWRG